MLKSKIKGIGSKIMMMMKKKYKFVNMILHVEKKRDKWRKTGKMPFVASLKPKPLLSLIK